MALSVDWPTGVISVLQTDLISVSGTLYELDTDAFRLELKSLEDNEEGMVWPRTHIHNTEVTVAGVTYARFVEMTNGYSITFENTGSDYSVRLAGSNNNIFDADSGILNSTPGVTVIGQNAAGLIVTATSGLTASESAALLSIDTKVTSMLSTLTGIDERELAEHVTNPSTGKIVIRNTTALRRWEANAWEDEAMTIPYRGKGLEAVEDLVEVGWS